MRAHWLNADKLAVLGDGILALICAAGSAYCIANVTRTFDVIVAVIAALLAFDLGGRAIQGITEPDEHAACNDKIAYLDGELTRMENEMDQLRGQLQYAEEQAAA